MNGRTLDGRALRKRLALFATAILIVWAVTAIWLVPWLIRSAYAGDAPAILNRLISGQSEHPVTRYLSLWTRFAWSVTAAMAACAAIGLAGAPYLVRAARRARTMLAASLPALTARDVFVSATFIGIISGLLEAAWAVWRRNVQLFPTGYYVRSEVYWMTPLAAVATFALVGAAVLVVDRALHGRGALFGLGPPLFAVLAVLSLIRALAVGVGNLAAVLLALGGGTAVARLLAVRPTVIRRVFQPAAGLLTAALVSWAVAVPLARSISLSRSFAALPAADPSAPNVLIVIWDAVRAMNLSLHGHTRETTPVLQRFAQQGTVFERAFATAPWSLPSHASMFTGRYPTEMTAGRQAPLDDTYPTLAEVLAGLGYATAGITANIYYGSSSFGIARGFASYTDVARIRPSVIGSTWWLSRTSLRWLRDLALEHAPGPLRPRASDVSTALLGWIDRREDRPFFAVINQFEAHDPYLPPEPFNLAFSDIQPRFWVEGLPIAHSPQMLEELVEAYDTSIRYLDYELGRLLDALRDRGALDNTIVIVTSDHGEEFGEHAPDLLRHGRSLYSTVLHVPLVIVAPARMPAGVRTREVVSIRDIPATVMDLIGRSPDSPFPGTSLLRYADGSASPEEAAEPRLAAAERSGLEGLLPTWPIAAGDMFSLIADDLHYIIEASGRESLYDLAADPWEERDLAGTPDAGPHLVRFRMTLDTMVRPNEDGVRRANIRR